MNTFLSSLELSFIDTIGGNLSTWGLKLLGGIAAFIVGLWIIRFILSLLGKAFEQKQMDPTLKPFLLTLFGFMMKAALFIAVASTIGIEVTSFVALLGAASLAVGLAFQGSLGNLASGVLLLVFRPFKVGDLIEANGSTGFVKEISVFVTFIRTFKNEIVIIPNSLLASGTVKNYSTLGYIRADIPFAIRYDADHKKATQIVLDILKSSNKVLETPAPSVYVTNLGESSVELVALPFCTVENYWDVFWGLRAEIKEQLGNAGFEAPHQQRVVTQK